MYGRAVQAAGYHLHRLRPSQLANPDFIQKARLTLWKQPAMPLIQTLQRQHLLMVLQGIHHHLGQSFRAFRDRVGLFFADAQMAGEGGSD